MKKISAIVHTYNEEKNIKGCLESIKWCDEIVIIDMHSNDKTVEIAKNYTDKIYYYKFQSYADPARNFGLDKAKGNWVLSLDADEKMPNNLVGKLKDIANSDKADVVYLPWKNIIFGKWTRHTQWWPDYHPRFFKKGHVTYTDEIHNFEKAKGRKMYLPAKEENAVIHYNYKDIKHFKEKTDRYTTIEAEKMYHQGTRANLLKMIYYPFKEFIWRYILGLGFLDGIHGLTLSVLMFRYKYITYKKLWDLGKNKKLQSQE